MSAAAPELAPAAAQVVALAAIRESKTNPRKHFAKDALDELTDSVRKHGVLSPILVRPIDAKGAVEFELVAGARRFRAAKAAGLKVIPAVVRELDDKAVLEIQVVENLQRTDLSPYEEACGYQQLHKQHGYAVDELAAKVGKSKAYVYARMKLCALPKGAQKLLEDGELDASRALLVARIPVPELAEQAAREIAFGEYHVRNKAIRPEPMSYREAVDHVQREYMLRLKDAPFPTGDAQLVPAAGACGTCPKRTGNQKGLFDDVQGADVCTDPKCFQEKVAAHVARQKEELAAQGKEILEGKAADRALSYGSKLVRLSDTCYDDPKRRTVKQLLKGEEFDSVFAASGGHVIELAPRAAVAKVLKASGVRSSAAPTRQKSAEEKRRALRAKAIDATVEDLVVKAEALKDEKRFLRFVVEDLFAGHSEPVKHVSKRRGWDLGRSYYHRRVPPVVAKALDAMTSAQLRGLAVELIALDYANPGYEASYGHGWTAACKLLGIDMRKAEARVSAAEKAKAKVKPKGRAKR